MIGCWGKTPDWLLNQAPPIQGLIKTHREKEYSYRGWRCMVVWVLGMLGLGWGLELVSGFQGARGVLWVLVEGLEEV